MRSTLTAIRLTIAVALVMLVSWRLHASVGLPLAPHWLDDVPANGSLKWLGALWWIALAVATSSAVALVVALATRLRRAGDVRTWRFVSDGIGIVIFAVTAIALSAFVFELPVPTVLATSSIVAVVLGFALQNTVADLLGGLALSIEQPFRVGDRVDVGERSAGRVLEMNWRATRILAKSGDVVIVPNSTLNRGRIINHDATGAPPHRASALVKVGFDVRPAHVRDVLRCAAHQAAGVLPEPPPKVEVAAYGDWAIDYKIDFYFTNWNDEGAVTSAVLDAAWTHLAWAGIAHATAPAAGSSPAGAPAPRSLAERLADIPIFAHLAPAERDALASQMRVVSLTAGESLITRGEAGASVFIVREGMFDVDVADEHGAERVVSRLFAGDYVGEASLMTGAPRNATVLAVSNAVVYEIDKTHFGPLLDARPDMAQALASVLVARAAERDAAVAARPGAARSAQQTLAHVAEQILTFFRSPNAA